MAQKYQISWVKNWSKHKSKIGPSMLRNISGPVLNGQCGIFFLFFLSVSLQKRRIAGKKGKRKSWTIFWLKKGKSWARFWLCSMMMSTIGIDLSFNLNHGFSGKFQPKHLCIQCFQWVGVFCCGNLGFLNLSSISAYHVPDIYKATEFVFRNSCFQSYKANVKMELRVNSILSHVPLANQSLRSTCSHECPK